MLEGFEAFFDWSSSSLHFDFIGDGVMSSFIESVASRRRAAGKVSQLTTYDTFGYIMNESDALRIPDTANDFTNIIVKPLGSEEDISVAESHWVTHKDASTRLARTFIQCLPSAGVYEHGKLVSWVLTAFYGPVSGLVTLQSHRGRGFGKVSMGAIAKAQAQQGIMPCMRVLRSNRSAQQVFKQVGYYGTHESTWVDYSET
jgi:GNAT superfamily N-acetyltransferase